MTVPEKMEALKLEYADLILNTAKEAAARVMASELKARRLEQDLISTKDEAARVLLRLKQMIDAKTKEAEITFLNQQRKVDELECQLNEAEGIILDLREERNQTQEQLNESSKNKTLHPLRQNENAQLCNMTPKGKVSGYELLFTASLDSGPELITADGKCCSPAKQSAKSDFECHVYSGNNHHNMTPIKEPDLFRNGCTQRVCATVSSLVNENLPLGDNSDPCDNSTNLEIRNVVGNPPVLEEKLQHGKNEVVSVVRRSLRKRKLKQWDDVIGACSHQFKKARHAISSLSCCKTNKVKHLVEFGDQSKKEDKTQIEKSLDCVAEYPNRELGHTENLPDKDLEFIDVLVKQDEHAEKFELNSSSKLDCDVKCATATEASNLCHSDIKRIFKYTFSRKRKKEPVIHPEKSSFEKSGLRKSPRGKQNGNSGFQSSRLLTKSSRDSSRLVQVAHQVDVIGITNESYVSEFNRSKLSVRRKVGHDGVASGLNLSFKPPQTRSVTAIPPPKQRETRSVTAAILPPKQRKTRSTTAIISPTQRKTRSVTTILPPKQRETRSVIAIPPPQPLQTRLTTIALKPVIQSRTIRKKKAIGKPLPLQSSQPPPLQASHPPPRKTNAATIVIRPVAMHFNAQPVAPPHTGFQSSHIGSSSSMCSTKYERSTVYGHTIKEAWKFVTMKRLNKMSANRKNAKKDKM